MPGARPVAEWHDPSRRIFYGWGIVGASFFGLALSQSPIAFITLSVFMKPLGQAFGWGRGPVSLALSVGALTLALATPMAGLLVDRFGARRIMVPSIVGLGLLMSSLYFLSGSLVHFYAIYFLIGVIGSGANNVTFMRVISAWFDRNRGLALGIASSGVTVGSAALAYFAQRLIDGFGWRVAYLGLGALVLFVGLPVVAIFIRERPPEMGPEKGSATWRPEGGTSIRTPLGMTTVDALREPTSWGMILIGFLVAVSLNGAEIHMIPLLTDRGISPDTATGLFALILGVFSTIGRLGTGWLFDRFFAPRVALVVFLLSGVGLTCVLVSNALWPCFIMVTLLGLGAGSESDVLGYLTGRYFGLKAFGQIYGLVFAGFMVGTAIGPYLFGLLFDLSHSYRVPLAISIGLILAMCAVLAMLPKFPDFAAGAENETRDAEFPPVPVN